MRLPCRRMSAPLQWRGHTLCSGLHAFPVGTHIADRTMMKDESTEQLTLVRFKAALQTTFRVSLGEGGNVELQLVEASGCGSAAEGERGESFSILFRGPGDSFLPQRMYSFQHDVMGTFDLFIVPVGEDKGAFLYEAIFNRRQAAS